MKGSNRCIAVQHGPSRRQAFEILQPSKCRGARFRRSGLDCGGVPFAANDRASAAQRRGRSRNEVGLPGRRGKKMERSRTSDPLEFLRLVLSTNFAVQKTSGPLQVEVIVPRFI